MSPGAHAEIGTASARWRWHRTQCKRHLQEHFLGYPEEFNEWPLGYAMYAHAQTQISNAQAGRLAFYHYDFEEGTSRLNQRGQDKLAKLGTYLPTTLLAHRGRADPEGSRPR